MPLKVALSLKLALILIVPVYTSRGFLHHVLGTRIFDLGLNRYLTILLTGLMTAALLCFLYVLLRDVLMILIKVICRSLSAASFLSGSLKLNLGVLLFFTVISVYAASNAFTHPVLVSLDIPMKNLPKEADGYRIAFLSDTHINYMTRKEEIAAYVDEINKQQPDLIVITGDFQDGTVDNIGAKVAELFKLKATDGIYGCEGNHEIYWNYQAWSEFLRSGGIRLLDNETVVIRSDNGRELFYLGGILDNADAEVTCSAFEGFGSDIPKILMSHRPGNADYADGKADLVLSGHTHGGMAPLVRNVVAMANHGYVSGLYILDKGTRLLVSNGTSMWQGFAFRLYDEAQNYILTLKAE